MITLTKNDENDEIIKVAQLSVEDALKELNTSQSGLTIDEVHTLQQNMERIFLPKQNRSHFGRNF